MAGLVGQSRRQRLARLADLSPDWRLSSENKLFCGGFKMLGFGEFWGLPPCYWSVNMLK